MSEIKNSLKVALIQLNASSEKKINLEKTQELLKEALKTNPDLICLPEVYNLRANREQSISEAETIRDGISTQILQDFAKTNKVWISNGSIFEKAAEALPYNTSILISDKGEIQAKYRKNHLFKVSFADQEVDESTKSQACNQSQVAKLTRNNLELNIGMSICYDLRFPELYRAYAKNKAKIILVPSSFAKKTGEAHWESLLRARAIENQAYVVAANQWGTINGLETYGNSMIISPWGEILEQASPDQDQIISCNLDLDYLDRIRNSLPALDHIKLI